MRVTVILFRVFSRGSSQKEADWCAAAAAAAFAAFAAAAAAAAFAAV